MHYRERLKIDFAGAAYDELKLMDRLIEMHELTDHRSAVHKTARPAILLKTSMSEEDQIPIGATKIGGQPGLPASTEWPLYRDGKPLAFLAQIDLAEIAKVGPSISGLPVDGLLSIFSVWGWMEDGLDAHPPDDGTGFHQEESGWTMILHTRPGTKLERRQTPAGLWAFKAAAVEPTLILTLPKHRVEPPLAALGWSDDVFERFDNLQSDFEWVQMEHRLKWNHPTDPSYHMLGGYALFQQQFPEEVLEKGMAMFLQLGTDENTGMCWGDGGELTLYADAKALAQGRFERLWGECQGG